MLHPGKRVSLVDRSATDQNTLALPSIFLKKVRFEAACWIKSLRLAISLGPQASTPFRRKQNTDAKEALTRLTLFFDETPPLPPLHWCPPIPSAGDASAARRRLARCELRSASALARLCDAWLASGQRAESDSHILQYKSPIHKHRFRITPFGY